MNRRFLIGLLVMVAVAVHGATTQPSWEEARDTATRTEMSERTESEQIEIYARDGYVYINTPHPTTVKIFSILGQLISQSDIPAGIYRQRIPSRGIYILKAGTITRRVTI